MSHRTEQAILFRIYTEDTDHRPEIIGLLKAQFAGFAILSGIGYWNHVQEQTIIIEVIGDYTDKHKVIKLAGDIKLLGNQDSVYVTTSDLLVNEV